MLSIFSSFFVGRAFLEGLLANQITCALNIYEFLQYVAVGSKEDLVQFIDVRTQSIFASEQFKNETNETSWNSDGTHFFVTNGQGQMVILTWPELKPAMTIQAHPSSLLSLRFSPTGQKMAVGSNDALATIWDVENLVCLRAINRLEWPIRTVSFSGDGAMLACGSEDLVIDVAQVESGDRVCAIPVENPTFSLAWHPKEYLLAFSCDDKIRGTLATANERDAGTIKLFGIQSAVDSSRGEAAATSAIPSLISSMI